MTEKIFLEKNRNIKALNKESELNINLTQKARLLPFDNLSDSINLSELFTSERDNCNKYRLIFTVNPICTNVLYNMKTEPVMYEGAESCEAAVGEEGIDGYHVIPLIDPARSVFGSSVSPDRLQVIRDTEYSHKDYYEGIVYHCGLDMLNNHMLRAKGFVHINKINTTSPEYNTIFDYERGDDGERISEYITDSPNTTPTLKQIHTYRIDNVMTFEEAYAQNVKEKDGWFGFTNVSFMEMPNSRFKQGEGRKSFNRVLNKNKPCEFIDFYPDRSLYSFVPKVNKERKRIEKNWDYCITYPYKSDKDTFKTIMGAFSDRIKTIVSTGKTANGYDTYVFKTIIKHNLKNGDTVKIYKTGDAVSFFEVNISGVGDVDGSDKEHCFRVYKNQLDIGNVSTVWLCKLSNGAGCEYYFRKFKKILNPDGSELRSNVGKLAFGENIYGDSVAEVIYTDDINLDELKDNLGRPLSEIYFTIVKTNKGHEKWYRVNANFSDTDIEFSHCFGKVTCGLDLIDEESDYNIKKLHNVKPDSKTKTISDSHSFLGSKTYDFSYCVPDINNVPKPIEDDITEDKQDEFFGDIVEFDPSTNSETILEKVYFRFNTAQRECYDNPAYFDIRYDWIISDDYNESVTVKVDGVALTTNGFMVVSDEKGRTNTAQPVTQGITETLARKTYINQNDEVFVPGNIQPEGYYYNPHHRIKVREISNRVQTQIGAVIDYVGVNSYITKTSNGEQSYFIDIDTTAPYDFIVGDLFGVYYKDKLLWGVVDKLNKTKENDELKYRLTIETSEVIPIGDLNPINTEISLTDGSVPMYASYVRNEQKFVWRDILKPSEVPSENPLSEMMFTNGANYIHSNVTFYVRRQDPFGNNGLLMAKYHINPQTGKKIDDNPMGIYKNHGFIFDKSQLMYLAIETQNACL